MVGWKTKIDNSSPVESEIWRNAGCFSVAGNFVEKWQNMMCMGPIFWSAALICLSACITVCGEYIA